MAKYVVLVDTSGSMYSLLGNIKTFLNSWFHWLVGIGPPKNDVALISFGNDVHIQNYYTQNVADLQTKVSGLVCGGDGGWLTALNDAILVGLVFEYPRADKLIVFSDGFDTCSDADEENWKEKSKALKIPVYPYPLKDMENTLLKPYVRAFTKRVVTIPMAMARWKEIAARVESVKVIEKPEDFLKLKPVEKKL